MTLCKECLLSEMSKTRHVNLCIKIELKLNECAEFYLFSYEVFSEFGMKPNAKQSQNFIKKFHVKNDYLRYNLQEFSLGYSRICYEPISKSESERPWGKPKSSGKALENHRRRKICKQLFVLPFLLPSDIFEMFERVIKCIYNMVIMIRA